MLGGGAVARAAVEAERPLPPRSFQGLHQVRSPLPGGLAALRKEVLLLL